MGFNAQAGPQAARVFTTLDEVLAAEGFAWIQRLDAHRPGSGGRLRGRDGGPSVDPRGHRAGAGGPVRNNRRSRLPDPLAPAAAGPSGLRDRDSRALLNYGVNKVRFPRPLLVGSRVRVAVKLETVQAMALGHQLTLNYVIEVEGEDKPACVAETVALMLP